MSNLSKEEYPLLETKEMANRKRELEKLNKTEIIKKLVPTEETLKFYYVQQGWQCPICKKILAPFMSHCPFHDEEHYKWSTTCTGSTLFDK